MGIIVLLLMYLIAVTTGYHVKIYCVDAHIEISLHIHVLHRSLAIYGLSHGKVKYCIVYYNDEAYRSDLWLHIGQI